MPIKQLHVIRESKALALDDPHDFRATSTSAARVEASTREAEDIPVRNKKIEEKCSITCSSDQGLGMQQAARDGLVIR